MPERTAAGDHCTCLEASRISTIHGTRLELRVQQKEWSSVRVSKLLEPITVHMAGWKPVGDFGVVVPTWLVVDLVV